MISALSKIQSKPNLSKSFLSIFYGVGIAGLIFFPEKILPFSFMILLMNFIFILLFETNLDSNKIKYFLFVIAASFAIEMIGVGSGKIFGSYYYGKSLGFSLKNVPLIIGINWLVLVLGIVNILSNFKITNDIVFSLCGGIFMVALDGLMERVAPVLDYWNFFGETAPLKNYIAWFIISFFFFFLFRAMNLKSENKISGFIYIIQFIFFVIANVIFWNKTI
jgi:putative membrane protein